MESNGDKLLERIEKEYQTRLRCTFIQEEKEKIKAEYAFLIEQINNSTKFKNERIELLQKLADYAIPTIISDEVSIILRESRNLDAQIQNLPEYISQQKKHLYSIASKLGKNNITYLHISTVVVEFVLMCILFEIKHIEDYLNARPYSVCSNKESYQTAYNLVNELEYMDMEYKYKYDRFSPCKKDILECCCRRYEFKTKLETVKDTAKGVGGCLGEMALKMFLVWLVAAILVMIFAN